jgi:hypothetical protein
LEASYREYKRSTGGWCTKEFMGPYGVSLWNNIRRDWESFLRFLSYEVGNGTTIHFWFDIWSGNQPLKEAFPELFCLARHKDADAEHPEKEIIILI